MAAKLGLFEMASGGTLFLDEIGDMGPTMQPQLLRTLQDGDAAHVLSGLTGVYRDAPFRGARES